MSKVSGLKIVESIDGSQADKSGIRKGDLLVAINDHIVKDSIDFHFYSVEDKLDCVINRNGSELKTVIRPVEGEPLGLTFEPMKYCACGNKCTFCFVDQNPEGMRETLYFKDEDFRMSFLYGNYVTLTRTTDDELKRIIEQRLSPLYVSIHAVNPEVRKELLGIKKDDRLLEKITLLADNDIEIHAQIVLCRHLNDGAVLEESVEVLSGFFPALRSLAIVPVGLTRHRKSLPEINGFDSIASAEVLEQGIVFQKRFTDKFDEPFVYYADEFYLQAGRPLPPQEHYGQFWQTGNGIGITREFLTLFNQNRNEFPRSVKERRRYLIATGVLAAPIIQKHVIPALNGVGNVESELCIVKNNLFGHSVTVSGLLCGRDIADAVKKTSGPFTLLLPPNCVNNDDLFLDDMTLEQMQHELNCEVIIVDDFLDLWENK